MIPAAFGYTRAGIARGGAAASSRRTATPRSSRAARACCPLMKLRLAQPGTLVDIGRLAELRGVERLDDGRLSVGALTTYAELIDSPADPLRRPGGTPCRTSATSRSATAAPSAAPSPTRTQRRTCRRRCSRSTRSWCSSRPAGRGTSGGRLLQGPFTTALRADDPPTGSSCPRRATTPARRLPRSSSGPPGTRWSGSRRS